MSENLATAIFLAALLAVGALYIAFKAYGWKVAALTIAAPFWLGWKTLRFSAFLGSRAVIGARRKRVKDPESAELVEREVINPPRIPKIQTLDHGSHNTPAGLIKAVHKVTLAESGAAKGQTGINYDIQFALQYSPENLMILEVKPDKDLSNVVYAYARPQDRIWEYTLQPGDEYSSSLNLASDLTQLKDMARMISHEKNSKDPHWNDKCANLIPSAGIALSDQDIYASTGQLTATLNYIRDAVTDRRWLDELRDHHPVVENVADAENEWSYIRSTATKHLDALSEMRLRRVFAGGPDTPQPTFRGYPGGGRDIVIVRPHEASAHREARYIIAVLDCLIRRATDAGYAGGPGTKGFFDEFASFMDLGSVGRYLNLGRTGKLQIHYVLQGRDQLEAAVGKTEARSIIQSTEIKCVGATTDLDLARMIAELSGQTRVDFRGAREGDEILGDWRDESRYLVNPQEITAQTEGQWTVVHRNQVYKREIPKRFYHHTQAAPPKEHPLWGWVDPETYRVPALRNPDDDPTPEDEDEYIA